ncbi:hypothetical protein E6H19_05820 [Candidatus Bathyarchaeota archaeon]|nr:MAG: hypothetical protein AUF79_13065 [Crenarchaeota archaeon 13_1_20CM_2_51_8]TMI28880.1 MAG: hypothetical protein E6H30_00125 [Candidatus Bathyarchaeota archaeon]TMI45053.1 MAG: hypothetical protein E6H19_05820 [Candidatus Bathyarchaeota archaeon]
MRIRKRYAAPIILAVLFSAVTVYAASELFYHKLSAPSTTAPFAGTLSSNCSNPSISPNPSSFSTTAFSAIFQCSEGGPPVTCSTPAGQATGKCSTSAVVSQLQGGSELTGSPAGYSAYNLYLVSDGSTISVDCASIMGGYVLFLSASPPSSTGQQVLISGTPSPGSSYDYCVDGVFSQPQGSDVFVSWL